MTLYDIVGDNHLRKPKFREAQLAQILGYSAVTFAQAAATWGALRGMGAWL